MQWEQAKHGARLLGVRLETVESEYEDAGADEHLYNVDEFADIVATAIQRDHNGEPTSSGGQVITEDRRLVPDDVSSCAFFDLVLWGQCSNFRLSQPEIGLNRHPMCIVPCSC